MSNTVQKGSTASDLALEARYHVERTWREIRNRLPELGPAPLYGLYGPELGTGSANDGQLSVRGSLKGGKLIEPRGDLVEDEKRDRSRNTDITHEATQGV